MPDADPDGSYIIQLIILFVLILINAFFAMAEMATVSANKNSIKALADDGNKRARVLLTLLEQPNKFLSTIQVCITLAGFLQSASAAASMSGDFSKLLNSIHIPYSFEVAVILITCILSYFNIVLGELVPKRIALQYSEKIAMFTARPVRFVSVIATPFIWFLSKSVAVVLRLFGIKKEGIEEKYSEDEIKMHLDVGIETGFIDEPSKEMIASVFEFDDKLAYEIMTPRTDIFMVSIGAKPEEYIDDLLKSRFSRIPYFDKDSDDIVGVLYMKDYIIQAKKVGFNRVNVKKLLQKPFFVPETKNINELFHEMQDSRIHMAFLIDEYGGVSGIVTIEDIIEEIMGAIDDEYEDAEPKLEQIDARTYRIDGGFYLDDLNDELGLSLESDDVETLGGLLMDSIGEIPDDDDKELKTVEIDGNQFTAEVWKERRIDKVLLEMAESPEDEPENPQPEGEAD